MEDDDDIDASVPENVVVTEEEVERLQNVQEQLWQEVQAARNHLQSLMDEASRAQERVDELERMANEADAAREAAMQAHTEQSFEATCRMLSRNDPRCTKVEEAFPDRLYPEEYGPRLGQALQGNSHVTYLSLTIDGLAHEEEEMQPLLRYIQSSPSLRSIRIYDDIIGWGDNWDTRMVNLILHAMAENPNIERFDGTCCIPAIAFCRFLQNNAASITDIVLRSNNGFELTEPEDRSNVAAAIRNVHSLQTLGLMYDDLAMEVFRQLKEAPSMLHTLKLHQYNHSFSNTRLFWNELKQFVQSTSVLKHLELGAFHLDDRVTEKLVDVLRQWRCCSLDSSTRRGLLKRPVCKLTLHYCCFMTNNAGDSFARFMQEMPVSFDGGDAGCNTDVSIPFLELEGFGRHIGQVLVYTAMRLPDTANPIPTETSRRASRMTPGSRLRTLTVDPVGVVDFLPCLTRNIEHVVLYALELTELDEDQCRFLSLSMPQWMSIRRLVLPAIPHSADNDCRERLLAGFHKNGSLHSVTIHDTGGIQTDDMVRINAFCQRNRFFAVHATLRAGSRQALGKKRKRSSSSSGILDQGTNGPNLFQVSQQVPKTRASRLVGCLLKLGNSDGDDG